MGTTYPIRQGRHVASIRVLRVGGGVQFRAECAPCRWVGTLFVGSSTEARRERAEHLEAA